jgi:hypothetical protein
MDDANVVAVRRWVIGILMLGPILCIGLAIFIIKSLAGYMDEDVLDDRTFERRAKEVAAAFAKDRTGTRQHTLLQMKNHPEDAEYSLMYLTFAEQNRLNALDSAGLDSTKLQAEAETALETQLKAMAILEAQRSSGPGQFFGSGTTNFHWESVLDFAVLAKRSDILREHAKGWAESGGIGIFADDQTRREGYTYLAWADLIDGNTDDAANNLVRSGDFVDAEVKIAGPSTKLADALISKGQYGAVITWIEKVGAHWKPKTTKEWIRWLKKGKRPKDESWIQQGEY